MKISFEDLKGKVCAITGGAGIIGVSMSKALSSLGVKMAIMDLNLESANKAAAEIEKVTGVTTIGVGANVLEETSLLEAKKTINNKLGPVNILINCAGGNNPGATTKLEMLESYSEDALKDSFFGLDIKAFQKVFDLNFIGTLLPTMVLARDMIELKKGSIINISSMSAYKPLTKVAAYSAAKAAISNFTEWLSTHFAKVNIRVNAIAPGFFLTVQNKFLMTDEKTGELTPRGKRVIQRTPMGKFGEPDDLAGTLAYLVSDISAFVTGIVIPVDGGFSSFSGV
ncbi:MAG: SDR family oxidoreductase [Spirochaetaceae bacterium]|nr:MAG: SDR family oxidoreductase [Spirochaetaceae bacterium]